MKRKRKKEEQSVFTNSASSSTSTSLSRAYLSLLHLSLFDSPSMAPGARGGAPGEAAGPSSEAANRGEGAKTQGKGGNAMANPNSEDAALPASAAERGARVAQPAAPAHRRRKLEAPKVSGAVIAAREKERGAKKKRRI